MPKNPPISDDKRFHHEISSGPSQEYLSQNPSIGYVENHNADWDYGLAADDYKMATDALIAAQQRDPNLDNWTSPICHLIRQTMELQLKSLLQMIGWKTDIEPAGILFTHNLDSLWKDGKNWLVKNGYSIENDLRLNFVDRLIANLHSIDPSGDLFRFGTSRYHAFGRSKTYDRVGYNQELLFDEFDLAHQCVSHWTTVVMREIIAKEEGWTTDPFFDPNDYPTL